MLYGNTKQKAHNSQLRAKDALQRNSIRRGWIKEQKSEPKKGKSRIRGKGGDPGKARIHKIIQLPPK